ncbi:MAG: diguanylate cyclase [Campylobacterales bacterium]
MTGQNDERLIQELMDLQSAIVILTDGEQIRFANRAFLEFLGFASLESFQQKHRCICEFFIDRAGYLPSGHGEWKDVVLANKAARKPSLALILKDGREHVFRVRVRSLASHAPQLIASFEDVTDYEENKRQLEAANRDLELRIQERTWELIEYNEELERQKMLLEEAQRIAHMGNWNYESAIKQFDASRALLEIFGYERAVHPMTLLRHLFKKDRRKLFAFLRSLRGAGEGESIELRILDHNKHQKTLRLYASAYLDDHGRVYRFSGVCQDVTRTVLLQTQAFYDHLTKTYNRHKMTELIERELAALQAEGVAVSLIMFDIDHFKRINDTFGHPAGDSVLVELSNRIAALLRREDIFARWGGEEFLIALPRASIETAASIAERLRLAVEERAFDEAGAVTCSFGVVEYRAQEGLHEGLKRCDDALYAAKRGGRNRVVTA